MPHKLLPVDHDIPWISFWSLINFPVTLNNCFNVRIDCFWVECKFSFCLFSCAERRRRRCSVSKRNITCAGASVTTKGRCNNLTNINLLKIVSLNCERASSTFHTMHTDKAVLSRAPDDAPMAPDGSFSPCYTDHLLLFFLLPSQIETESFSAHECSQKFVKKVHVSCHREAGSLYAANPGRLLRFWSHRSSTPLNAANSGLGLQSRSLRWPRFVHQFFQKSAPEGIFQLPRHVLPEFVE